jgi:hypothetical protein
LFTIFCDLPETKNIIISDDRDSTDEAKVLLYLIVIVDDCVDNPQQTEDDITRRRDIVFCLLRVVNAIIYDDYEVQENLCFVGGIPITFKPPALTNIWSVRVEVWYICCTKAAASSRISRPILEILDTTRRRDIVFCLLRVVNAIIYDDYEVQD